MANSIIVIGAQWGDEGKGKIIDLLTRQSTAVVRFQGGHNAGHTLVIEGDETILHLIPSGIFNDVDCVIANGVVLHLPTLFDEITLLQKKGVSIDHKLHISTLCPLIFPSHIALDNAKEKTLGSKAIGTTGRGIGPAYEDKVARRAIHLSDLFDAERFLEKLNRLMELHNFLLVNYYNAKPLDVLSGLFHHVRWPRTGWVDHRDDFIEPLVRTASWPGHGPGHDVNGRRSAGFGALDCLVD